jgi:transketolase
MRKAFIDSLIKLARKDERVFLVTADMGYSVLEPFQEEFPDRFLNSGVAEQNSVGLAAGLALSGYIPYVYSIIPFVTMRCFEQIRVDVAYMQTNVRLIGVGAGFEYGSSGATHHSLEDIAVMRALAGMTVCCPGDNLEAEQIITQSLEYQGPIYIRIGKNKYDFLHEKETEITISKAAILQSGERQAFISTSNTLGIAKANADKVYLESGFKPYVISMHTVKPLDTVILDKLIKEKVDIVSIEEHNLIGGLGSAIAEYLCDVGANIKLQRIAVPDCFSHLVGDQNILRSHFSLLDYNG